MINTLSHAHFSLDVLQSSLGFWVYLLLSVVVAVEGPIATLAGAGAASLGYLNPVLVFIFASLGNLTADILWYGLGYMGKTEWLVRHGSWLGIKESSLTRLQEDVQTHIHKILFVAKLTLGFMVPILITTGLMRIPVKRWFGVLFGAECIWTGSLVFIGYHFGRLILNIQNGLRWVSLGGAAIFLIILLFYLIRRQSDPNVD
jgi:membrane protein DedA with SNARE-associated domain